MSSKCVIGKPKKQEQKEEQKQEQNLVPNFSSYPLNAADVCPSFPDVVKVVVRKPVKKKMTLIEQ